jgi:hypothetical protein
LRSADRGETFEQIDAPFRMGGNEAGRSDDAGANWRRVNDDRRQFGWINQVVGDPRVYGRVYVATGGRGILFGEPAIAGAGIKP